MSALHETRGTEEIPGGFRMALARLRAALQDIENAGSCAELAGGFLPQVLHAVLLAGDRGLAHRPRALVRLARLVEALLRGGGIAGLSRIPRPAG